MTSLLARIDAQVDQLAADWNIFTTLLALTILGFLAYPVFFSDESDTHPLLLSRQANVAPVRQPGESAVYRSLEVPIDYPLKSGLNVKDEGAARWASGKDGDLRDVWRRAISGDPAENEHSNGRGGKIFTIYGREEVDEHDLDAVSKEINIVGRYIWQQGGFHTAVYLPNSIELLAAVFAAAFYGFNIILLPFNQTPEHLVKLLQSTDANFLIASAGSVPLDFLTQQCPKLKEVMWVVEKTSRHMDFRGPAEPVSVWHQLVKDAGSSVTSDLPKSSVGDVVPNIIMVWQDEASNQTDFVTFTQNNLVAAIAGQLSALPTKQRLKSDDLFLPAESFTISYVLIQTLAAIYSNASVAINSVAGPGVDLALVARGLAPTIIVASAESALRLLQATKSSLTGVIQKLTLRSQLQELQAGHMPYNRLFPPMKTMLGTTPSKLRLIYVFERIYAGTPPLSSIDLAELRALTGARIAYALTAAKVAGAVTQTNIYDYRTTRDNRSHFGAPVSCVEVKLKDTERHATTDDAVVGEIVVSGPAVVSETAMLGATGRFREDGTLAYL